ncbi:hypothetical protein MNAN1_001291 [Malassezia nana]|uniref:Transcription factor CBF/NF-Y/archaeal histone domain-containing protein n=1 Tax=Malassezia nana TaxID=180528 RepID=A0AAF0EQG6_9BASI|nr:hypothetical protein MNAN1_001291 [Malassezia nana]
MVKRSTTSKFPIARIKRIMQADEDVGKVAQATPVVISKALELFMQEIVERAAEQTRSTGGKRVSPYHLYVKKANSRKRAALATETFDFLKDIVDKVPDPLETGGGRTTKRRKVARSAGKEEGALEASASQDAAPADAAPSDTQAAPAIKEADDSDE